MGDMNCNLALDQLDNNANILSSIADIYGMHQLIIDPTRCTASSSTLIDCCGNLASWSSTPSWDCIFAIDQLRQPAV